MLVLRLFFAVLVAGAIATIVDAVYLTFEPMDAPPKGGAGAAPLRAEPGGRPPAPAAHKVAEVGPAAVQGPPAIDRLRRSVEVARSSAGEAKRVGADIASALPEAEELTVENAWRQAKRAATAVVGDTESVVDMDVLPSGSRMHGSGAPAQGGSGYGRQPGVDWYREGGKGAD